MSQPANDDFSQHLSDDEASYHEGCIDRVIQNGNSRSESSTGIGWQGKNHFNYGHSKGTSEKIHWIMDDAKSILGPLGLARAALTREVPVVCCDEVIYSLFAKQSEDLDLLHEDLEQIDDMDIEEMDINWQIAMIAIRMKKEYAHPREQMMDKKRDSFYQDQGAGKKEQNQNCLLTMDDGVVNWGEHTVEEEKDKFIALMAN
ncbi:hypothetical protein Tco_0703926 [Tanacetum coccineum]|uniref:Uncharacterized protein n=1 Tax=Tanacetum coccineum TaxID=301880 RepID=A0ABQ4Y080_9ASTR